MGIGHHPQLFQVEDVPWWEKERYGDCQWLFKEGMGKNDTTGLKCISSGRSLILLIRYSFSLFHRQAFRHTVQVHHLCQQGN